MASYEVRISPEAKAGLEVLPGRIAAAAINYIRTHLRSAPERAGVEMRGTLKGTFVAKRGQYRIVYRIDEPAGFVDVLQILAQF